MRKESGWIETLFEACMRQAEFVSIPRLFEFDLLRASVSERQAGEGSAALVLLHYRALAAWTYQFCIAVQPA